MPQHRYTWGTGVPTIDIVTRVRDRVTHDLGEPSLDHVSLRELSFAFPENVRGRRYRLEEGTSRRHMGNVEAAFCDRKDSVLIYVACALKDGQTFEAVKTPNDPRKLHFMFCGEAMGCIKESKTTWYGQPKQWEVWMRGKAVGSIRKPFLTTLDSFAVRMADGQSMPVRNGRQETLSGIVREIWRLLAMSFLWQPPNPNTDYVIRLPRHVEVAADNSRMLFATNVLFRMIYVPFDFSHESD